MSAKQLLENQKSVVGIMKTGFKQPAETLSKLQELLKDTEQYKDAASPEYFTVASTIYEAMGDVYQVMKNPQEAEKAFQEMVKKSLKLYELDKQKHDFRLGAANYKLGLFYRSLIGCHILAPKPRVLNEGQKKVFEIAEQCFKNSIGYTMQNARKGILRYVEFHTSSMEALMILHAAVGNYETSVLIGKDCVRLGKIVYDKKDDQVQGIRLANQMTALAGVYSYMNNPQLSMENLEDANFVLEAHQKAGDLKIGAMLARNYISLGSCYSVLEEEKENAEETYQKGLNLMMELNEQSNNRMVGDVIQSYIFVGDYYMRTNRESDGKLHYTRAEKLASDMYRVTKQKRYEMIMKQLQKKIQ